MRKTGQRSVARRVAVSGPSTKDSVRDEIIREGIEKSTLYLNLSQDMIVISEDRLRLQLNDLVTSAGRGRKWQTPAAMLVTEVAAFAGPNFRSTIVLSVEQWNLLFGALTCVTLLWLLKTLVNAWSAPAVDVDAGS